MTTKTTLLFTLSLILISIYNYSEAYTMNSKEALTQINFMLDKAIESDYLFTKDKMIILAAIKQSKSSNECRAKVLKALKNTGIPQFYVTKYFNSKVGPLLDALTYGG